MGGRPLKFESVEALEKRILEYKEYVKENKKPMTLERLAVFLDCSTETLRYYGKDKEEYFATIKKIREEIGADKVERLNTAGQPVAGIIFDLKNNHGMKDKQEIDMNIKGEVSLSSLAKQAIEDKTPEDEL